MSRSSDLWVSFPVAGRATLTRPRSARSSSSSSKSRILSRSLAVLVAPLLLLAGCGSKEAAPPLRFSAIPNSNTTELEAKLRPVADHLSAKLGVPVEYVPVVDYAASVAAFTNGDIQLAWFGGLTGVQARAKVPGAQAIAQGKKDPSFRSYFIAHADTGIAPSSEFPMALAGKTFTFGSASSTSGRLMPEYFVRQFTGKSPKEFFGQEPAFSGKHDATAVQVQNHTFDAGALDYVVYDRLVSEGKIDPTVCVKIWESPTFSDYQWTAHPVLTERYGEGFLERLQKELIAMSDPALLAALDRPDGLVAARNEDYEKIRETALALDMLR